MATATLKTASLTTPRVFLPNRAKLPTPTPDGPHVPQ
jgi:hypothetical protein